MKLIDKIKAKIDDYRQYRKVKYCMKRYNLYYPSHCFLCKYRYIKCDGE